MPVFPSWLTDPLWDQSAALLPKCPAVDPAHSLSCHRRRISDRTVFDKRLQLLRFGCSYQAVSDTTCSATTLRNRRNEWIRLGVFARLSRVLAGANRHDSPLLAPTLDLLVDLGPLPGAITVHLDAGYDSGKTRAELAARSLHGGCIAHKGEKVPIQASQR